MQFVARQAERQEIVGLVAAAAGGAGGALVIAGEAGIGKTSLLDAAVGAASASIAASAGVPGGAGGAGRAADGQTVLRAAGAEFEKDLLYAALHQLCAPVLDHRRALPPVQAGALEAVFGLGEQTSPDPLTVGLAVLGLLREVARERPVCCVVDDAQWIDEASRRALVFVARRVALEPIAVVFAARDVGAVPGLADLPRIALAGLADEDARTVLGTAAPAGLDGEVVDRILAEARGNPLALLEFAHDAGPFGVPSPRRSRASVVDALEEQFVHRFERLPSAARLLVVLAAAEPVGDLGVLRRAAAVLDLDIAELDAAENAGLLALGPRLRFRHPLVRSAVYASATPGTRRRVHGALAEATDPSVEPDRKAWHRAHAVAEADEEVAAELARCADRARLRGGFAAAAAFMERAAQLTPPADHHVIQDGTAHGRLDQDRIVRDPLVRDGEGAGRPSDRRPGRLLAAAQLRLRAGAPTAARALVARTEAYPMDAHGHAEARVLRARADFQLGHSPEATARLVEAAADLPPEQARETYLEAFSSFIYNDNEPGLLQRLGARIREQAKHQAPPRPVDLLLDALLDQNMLPVGQAVPAMRRAAAACRHAAVGPWRMNLVCQMVIDLREDGLMEEIADRQVAVAREQGALATLPQALRYQAISKTSTGRFDDAAAHLGEARAVDEAAGTSPLLGAELVYTAFRGDLARARELLALMGRDGQPRENVAEHYAMAVLHNGLGNFEAALESALAAQHRHQAGSYSIWAVYAELVEAAARSGRPDDAETALNHLEALARANPVPWALGEYTHARALLGRGDPDMLYREAIGHFAETRIRVHHARALLTYGEWLRREQRREHARTELRAAHRMLADMGAHAYAERAAQELRATGERLPLANGEGCLTRLSAQERLIAEKVAAGATSKEVAATLFLSPRTVDSHLRNIFRKLGISSRRQLRDLDF
ncbi:helix-turn-helix transcriptional regulator [Actinomadura rupiterrae]|uniref:helix-turn-helix transcriptional regulator n=1 Tax=Actinomadura rupiterrae TaxID=559627 RepID=UPI0020A33167|nr:AAA family ATPase [Actinomadura rupiterrae]MCP2342490.1 DNA-binding CsgD family transcriptional regulator [Actinomadura rupiterrae]